MPRLKSSAPSALTAADAIRETERQTETETERDRGRARARGREEERKRKRQRGRDSPAALPRPGTSQGTFSAPLPKGSSRSQRVAFAEAQRTQIPRRVVSVDESNEVLRRLSVSLNHARCSRLAGTIAWRTKRTVRPERTILNPNKQEGSEEGAALRRGAGPPAGEKRGSTALCRRREVIEDMWR